MSTIGTFDTFTTARLGIYAAQKGLSVTGNNISNINTTGYTRQSLDQVSMKTGGSDRYRSELDAHVGTGVLVKSISQTRDQYLDIRYRTQEASVGSMDTMVTGLNSLADILDEVGDGDNNGDGIIEAQINDLVEALENLNANAGHEDYDTLVRESASSLCTLLNSYSKRLTDVKENTVDQMYQEVDSINEILYNIRDLNSQIRKSEIHGDSALELRDDRNNLIDELSQYLKIDVTYSMEDLGGGQEVEKLTIRLGGANSTAYSGRGSDSALLVDGVYATQLSFAAEAEDEVLATASLDDAYTVGNFDQYTEPEDQYNIVLSELTDSKGRSWSETTAVSESEFEAALARVPVPATADAYEDCDETHVPASDTITIKEQDGTITTYTAVMPAGTATFDVRSAATYVKTTTTQNYMLNDNDLYGSLQSYRELLTEAGEFTTATAYSRDSGSTTKRGIPYYQESLDLLAQTLAEKLNALNTGYLTDTSGNYLKADGTFVTDASGNVINKDTLTDAQKAVLEDNTSGSVSLGGDLFSTVNGSSTITAENICVSTEWAKGTTRIVQSYETAVPSDASNNYGIPSTANDNIARFVALFSEKIDFYPSAVAASMDTTSMFSGTFQEMLTNMSGVLGDDIRSDQVLLNNYEAAATELDSSRESVSGVELNDEAMNLMTYQKAYAAACRLMTTLDEALDKLINGTGTVGL
jgi:flagellar hook-associated protein 1 FlgK